MNNAEAPEDFWHRLHQRVTQVLDHVQLDSEASARGAVLELHALVEEAETHALNELAEQARDALAEAWRWRRGADSLDTMDARVRLARLARTLWQQRRQAARRTSLGSDDGEPRVA